MGPGKASWPRSSHTERPRESATAAMDSAALATGRRLAREMASTKAARGNRGTRTAASTGSDTRVTFQFFMRSIWSAFTTSRRR